MRTRRETFEGNEVKATLKNCRYTPKQTKNLNKTAQDDLGIKKDRVHMYKHMLRKYTYGSFTIVFLLGNFQI